VALFSIKVYAEECHWLRFFPGVDSLDMLGKVYGTSPLGKRRGFSKSNTYFDDQLEK